ncbi:MAG: acyltransferase domain-containing protein [Chitinivibrionales bacterium]|nr:acyltransferase domain-containing protein [Chitinivibrionales bacterium]
MFKHNDDIAIIGMSCIYPGSPSVKSLWNNILRKRDVTSDPPEGWGHETMYDPDSQGRNDRVYCKRGGFISDYAEFNSFEFGIMPNAIEGSDPAQFLALRLAKEALVDAGYAEKPFNRQATGVILGLSVTINKAHATVAQHSLFIDETLGVIKQLNPELEPDQIAEIRQELKNSIPPFNADTCPGVISNLLTGNIANRLDLQGPNYTLDAACASSSIALNAGIRELQSGASDMMLVGGVQAPTSAATFVVFSLLGALSKRGRLRPFDKNADGTLLGEGLGMIVIKRKEDAIVDGDRIYACIKGLGMASDGKGLGALVPRREGQVLAVERAYQTSGIDKDSIELIEAHGTATIVGDKTEMSTLTEVFGVRKDTMPEKAVGSVKSMIGHSMPAAAMASIMKTALALYNKVLPPTLCDDPNPGLNIEQTPFHINTEVLPWIHSADYPRRAGVNAFGFGGINTHTILEEHVNERTPLFTHDAFSSELFAFAADTKEELRSRIEKVQMYCEREPGASLKNIAFTCADTAGADDAHTDLRAALVADSISQLRERCREANDRLDRDEVPFQNDRHGIYIFAQKDVMRGKVAFLFSGEGSQYPRMLGDLCLHFPEVREAFDNIDRAFWRHKLSPLPGFVVFPRPHCGAQAQKIASELIWEMNYAVVSVLAANHGLYRLLTNLGIKPDALCGHSIGQDYSVFAGGIYKNNDPQMLIDAWIDNEIIAHNIVEQIPHAKLLAVGAAPSGAVRKVLDENDGRIAVAMDNCPNQVIICGTENDIIAAQEKLTRAGALCLMLPFDRGYHTDMYRPLCERIAQHADSSGLQSASIPVYSTSSTQIFPGEPERINKLLIDQWAMPVRFRETVETMYADGYRIFIEVGPNSNLTGFVRDILDKKDHLVVATNEASRPGMNQLQATLGKLFVHRVPFDQKYLFAHRSSEVVQLDKEASAPSTVSTRSKAYKLDLLPQKLKIGRTGLVLRGSKAEFGHKPVAEAQRGRQFGPSAACGGGNDVRAHVMNEHFAAMQRFVASQHNVTPQMITGPPPQAGSNSGSRTTSGVARYHWNIYKSRPGIAAVLCRNEGVNEGLLRDYYLTAREQSAFAKLNGNAGLRGYVLMNLCTAKEAASLHFRNEHRVYLKPGEIETRAEHLKVYCSVLGNRSDLGPIAVALAHCASFTAAITVGSRRSAGGLGFSILDHSRQSRTQARQRIMLYDSELSLLAASGQSAHELQLAVACNAKRAVLNALGAAEDAAGAVEITSFNPQTYAVEFEITTTSPSFSAEPAGERITAQGGRDAHFTYAYALS